MGFMQPQFRYDTWLKVEGDTTSYIPADLVPEALHDGILITDDNPEFPELVTQIVPFLAEGEGADSIYAVEKIEGWGARMSAPGYMDCTEWSVFPTKEEAEQYIQEYYDE